MIAKIWVPDYTEEVAKWLDMMEMSDWCWSGPNSEYLSFNNEEDYVAFRLTFGL